MRVWLTIETNREEIDDLLTPPREKEEGVSKTPLKAVIDHALCLMSLGHKVALKLTTMTWREN